MFRRKSRPRPEPQPAAWWDSPLGRVSLVPLRELEPVQWHVLTAMYRDSELARLNAAEPSGLPHWFLRLMLLGDAGTGKQRAAFGVVLGGRLMGNAELYDFAPAYSPTRATLGVMLARGEWGKGLGTAALQALLAYAFGHAPHSPLQLERVRLSTLQSNTRAQRAFMRVGFRETGRGVLNGQAMLDMEVRREEWAKFAAE